jgi:hypothetical protein
MFNDLGIDQGIEFKNLSKKNYSENEHHLLQETSSPQWKSIVEDFNGDTINLPHASSDETHFNSLISSYASAYNTYTSSLLSKPSSDESRIAVEADLIRQKNLIIAAATQINNSNIHTEILEKQAINSRLINSKLIQLAQEKNKTYAMNENYDENTVSGAIETTSLNMNSMYYHYIVYFIVAITLISFTFNIMINPEANVMNAVFVVGALVLVFLIARH